MQCTFAMVVLVLVLSFASDAAATSHPEREVTSLPGYSGTFGSKHFAGYITVNEEHKRSLFFYFVTSEGNPERDPLVLWVNGGPGCSSFDGWIYEHGPFTLTLGKDPGSLPTLERNPYTWARVANVLYVDSPAGVGLSTTEDWNANDSKTAADMHAFLLKWLTEFSEYQGHDFFVSGESYGGIYVPMITREVVRGIEAGVSPTIHLKGYMIGNGCTDAAVDGNALVPFAYGHGLISIDQFQNLEKVCGGNYWNATGKCYDLLDKASQEVEDLNIYDILEPCYHGDAAALAKVEAKEAARLAAAAAAGTGGGGNPIRLPASFKALGRSNPRATPVRARMVGRAWPLRQTSREGRATIWGQHSKNEDPYVPCTDERIGSIWLNDAGVRAALHAAPVADAGRWLLCTERLTYISNMGSMIPIHRNLTTKGYRALIYSGDHDMCVPYTGSEVWTRGMGYEVTDRWRPWYLDAQVAGYTRGYAHGLTFATIAGSGHTVPEYKPAQALAFFSRWLAGEPL